MKTAGTSMSTAWNIKGKSEVHLSQNIMMNSKMFAIILTVRLGFMPVKTPFINLVLGNISNLEK
jgi:hypothetical protein